MKPGDIIVEANGIKLAEAKTLTDLARSLKPGDPLAVRVWRQVSSLTITVVSAELPQSLVHVEQGSTGDDLTESFLPDGPLSEIRDRYGNTLTFHYIGSRLSALVSKSGRSLSFESDERGLIVAVSDPSGRRWRYGYDGDGNLASTAGPDNTHSLLNYDTFHNLTAITFPDGSRQEISYDEERDIVTERRGPGTSFTGYRYRSDAHRKGLLEVTVTDGRGNPTRYEYENLPSGRKVGIIDPLGGRQVKGYDQFDNLVSLTDENGAVTTFRYDACNRMTGKRDGEGNT